MPIVFDGSAGTVTGITTGGLPDGCVDSDTLASGLASQGITMADTWAVSSSFNGSATPISSNWSQYTNHNTGTIGSAMTQSSGVFTFPSTGIYEIWWFSPVSYTHLTLPTKA